MPYNSTEHLTKLRALMHDPQLKLDAYVVPSEDAHQSEYVHSSDKRRAFISGFTGSSGSAVITHSSANIFTDGRYFLQASKEIDENWTLMKVGLPGVPTVASFLSELPSGNRIGIDPTLISASEAERIKQLLIKNGSELVPVSENLIDKIWQDKPVLPTNPVVEHQAEFSGVSWQLKVQQIREELKKQSTTSLVIAALDQIAWLFNLRGSDIEFNPVFFSYALLTMEKTYLFIEKSKLTPNALKSICGVEILPYNEIFSVVKTLSASLAESNTKILADSTVSWALVDSLGEKNVITKVSPITMLKAVKNDVELNGMRQSHIRDGVAMAKFYAWLEHELIINGGHLKISECDAADKMREYREEQQHYRGLSFETISSAGPNSAVIHYGPVRGTDLKLDINQLYLNDSGGHYNDGSTDVTRTWHFGTPTDWEKECYTRVLQGHIAVDSVVFPEGTTGYSLDILARKALWQAGLDFRHGTGHGVGSVLNIHEGPFGISSRPASAEYGLYEGYVVTNEPGYYEDGNFGIRIENTCIITAVKTPNNFGGVKFLKLDPVTLCPIQSKLISSSLLNRDEINWINEYHKRVWDTLSPLLKDDTLAYNWLQRNTSRL
ncbi:hypothetical protein BB561_001004 [Smittium simulii]|uniref:Xaa-Pro aminopeptidase P n=1 Tax=Smittium simulii TaxID=133385 RepID=A0A2T9YWP1_9FUNG|nr:hypothetical protein BB561_001004 [Smittium simulii]